MYGPAAGKLLDAPTSYTRSDGIDLLRGLFAVWVLMAHLVPWSALTSGGNVVMQFLMNALGRTFQPAAETHPAVLGFIVLSGYCIHRNGFRRNEWSLNTYAIRRFFRILPVYALASLAGILGFLLCSKLDPQMATALSGTQEISAKCIVAKFTGIAVFFPRYFQCSFEGNAPLTTVMVEIWLYALYALVVFRLLKLGRERTFWLLLICLWSAGALYTYLHPQLLSWWHNGSLLGFTLYWWIGAKFINPDFCAFAKRWNPVLAVAWATLTLCLLFKIPDWPVLAEARKIIFALLVGSLISGIDQMNVRSLRSVTFIGVAGYSIYAFHAPLLILLLLLGLHWALVAGLTIGLSLLAYRVYEEPLIGVGKRLSKGVAARTAAAAP